MNDIAISVERLSKAYCIGMKEQQEDTLAATLVGWAKSPLMNFRRLRQLSTWASPDDPESDGIFWALKDVNFEVNRGDVVGVVGRNGAGKSTLLKILSRITNPTAGRVVIRGRVSSLLEVGTGFHPELTGRENVYLNGTILGMTRREIDRKFDQIVDFSGVEKFIDTPVKRYSSGMKVRLAFSVAAHLEPEILIIDEVLAVGDAEFQRKCLGKMKDVAKGGRTVLFVSHNMAAVEVLCGCCVMIESGRMKSSGPTADVLRLYKSEVQSSSQPARVLTDHPGRSAKTFPLMRSVTLKTVDDVPSSTFEMGETLTVEVTYQGTQSFGPALGVIVKTDLGAPLFGIDNRMVDGFGFPDSGRSGTIRCHIEHLPLNPGSYSIDLYLGDRQRSMDCVRDAISFDVIPADVFGSGKIPDSSCGPVFHPATFSFDPETTARSLPALDDESPTTATVPDICSETILSGSTSLT